MCPPKTQICVPHENLKFSQNLIKIRKFCPKSTFLTTTMAAKLASKTCLGHVILSISTLCWIAPTLSFMLISKYSPKHTLAGALNVSTVGGSAECLNVFFISFAYADYELPNSIKIRILTCAPSLYVSFRFRGMDQDL